MEENKRVLEVWFAVNKDGFVGMYLDKPIRNKDTMRWESKRPFLHLQAYSVITQLAKRAKMGWENEPELMPFQFS